MLFADTERFTFEVSGKESSGMEDFSVYAFKGHEEVSKPYEFVIELAHRSAKLNLADFIGQPGLLRIHDQNMVMRPVHGYIRSMAQIETTLDYSLYRVLLVPRFDFLKDTSDHRIFQDQNILEIIETILTEKHLFTGESFEFRCFQVEKNFPKREFCVQYGESDFDFISRLCEEEGVYYFFEHEEDRERMVFCNTPSGAPISPRESLRFFKGSGQVADETVISSLSLHQEAGTNLFEFRDWNFEMPSARSIPAKTDASIYIKAHPPTGLSLEKYRYPHLYTLQKEGDRYACLEEIRRLSFAEWIEGKTDAVHLVPGYVMEIHSHPNPAVNTEIYEPESYGTSSTAIGPRWWIFGVTQEGEQPQVLGEFSPDRGFSYKASFIAIPSKTRFIPEAIHRKNRVIGDQTAIVTGPEGEEIYTDKYGRVKVQLHWDRQGNYDEKTTCWVRVSQGWAGNTFGVMALPRIGQEVVVSFLEGDPDRPLITGRVYNAHNMPSWDLPGQRSLFGIQSREIHAGRKNQLIMDDTKGEIQTQLSSDHLSSQLNLGYITRVEHNSGRKDFRGEGFELRTDGWGALRAAKGVYISSYTRESADKHHKDLSESIRDLDIAAKQHAATAKLARTSNAQEFAEDVDPIEKALQAQVNEIKGDAENQGELKTAHVLVGSPAGIEMTTQKTTHLHAGEHLALTAEKHASISSGKSFLVSAKDKISLFAHKLGIRIMASAGKVEIEAQSDCLDLISEKEMRIFSTKDQVHISSAKEVLITAGGSYIRIGESGIEQGTLAAWKAKAASHSMEGGAAQPYLQKEWEDGEMAQNARVNIYDEMGRVLPPEEFLVAGNENLADPASSDVLEVFASKISKEKEPDVLVAGESPYTHTFEYGLNVKQAMAAVKKAKT